MPGKATGSKPGRHAFRVRRLLTRANRDNDLILDAGAGNSPYRMFLRGRVTGLDINPGRGVSTCSDLAQLPFAAGTFDGVCCFQVLYYAPAPCQWIVELARVLKPGGWMAISISRPGARNAEACRTGLALCCWNWSQWQKAFQAAGMSQQTPWVEQMFRSKIGAYIFGLFSKA